MALDHLPLPSMLLGPRGEIVQGSAAASAVLAANRDLLRSDGGSFTVLAAPCWVDTALARLAAGDAARGRRLPGLAALALARPDKLPLTLLLRPWQGVPAGRPTGLLNLCDPHGLALDTRVLRRLFDLTEVEAAIAALLAEGLSTAEIAVLRGRQLNTVQSHVKHLLAKTGTPRQAAMVSLLWRTVAAQRVDIAAPFPAVAPPCPGGVARAMALPCANG